MKTLRRRLLGLALIAVMVGGVALSIALYDKAFTSVVTVKLEADSVGNFSSSVSKATKAAFSKRSAREPSATGKARSVRVQSSTGMKL